MVVKTVTISAMGAPYPRVSASGPPRIHAPDRARLCPGPCLSVSVSACGGGGARAASDSFKTTAPGTATMSV
ncbi:hypothetical protein GCM10009863_06970 [Streptomyces axinellae]|uniref:Uncharacterized protein n=1 Tax=Streptomyces axinellae TaxID=552788 RepID=A0ABP6C221_9ACTN